MKNITTYVTTIQLHDDDFCKTQVENVPLLCYCLTPWIDGSTSAAIYGKKQKEFNVYNCVNAITGIISIVLKPVVSNHQGDTVILYVTIVNYQTR